MKKECKDFIVYAAQNEQVGWTSDEIGWKVLPMPLKSASGLTQVGDYYATCDSSDGIEKVVPILIERKTAADLYSTLMKSDNRKRFYAEIERFYRDNRFDQMVVIVEGTMEEFMTHRHIFNPKTKKYTFGASANSRRASIASLFVRGVPVLFAGTRYNAIQMFKDLVRQAIKHKNAKHRKEINEQREKARQQLQKR